MVEPKILRELLDLLRRPEIPVDVRSAIADELGKRQYLPAKDFLLQGLTDPDSNMRSACIRALGIDMEIREAAPTLVEILLNDEYEHVKIDAAYGLGSLRYKPAIPALKAVILDERYDMTLREAAYKAVLSILGKEQDGDEIPVIGKPTVIDWDLVHKL
jgi:HEAT repeat protein